MFWSGKIQLVEFGSAQAQIKFPDPQKSYRFPLHCTQMFDSICSFPLASDLFTQAIHPSDPILAVGLSSGHVESFKLPPIESDDGEHSSPSKGRGQIESIWRTRRHKISCRCLSYSLDGSTLYSAGADGIVKAANSTTGQVSGKVALPLIV
jgi:WD repeat-containing protein 55